MNPPNNTPPNIEWYCLDDERLKLLTDRLASRILASLPDKDPEFIPPSRVMEILNIKKTKLNDLHKAGEFKFYQEREGTKVMYLTKSVYEYQQRNLK